MTLPILMRYLLALIVIIAAAVQSPAAQQPAPGRTIQNLPNFPLQALRSGVGRKLYSSLAISPVSTWLTARAGIMNGHTGGAQIIHAEGDRVYEKGLLEMANSYTISGQNTTESRLAKDTLTVELLVYDLKDGKMAIIFAHNDDARYQGRALLGTAWVGLYQGGKWVTISGEYPKKWGGRHGAD